MELFQDQGIIKIVVVVLALLIAWWAFRMALRWAFRLSRLGCLAILGLTLIAALASRLN